MKRTFVLFITLVRVPEKTRKAFTIFADGEVAPIFVISTAGRE